MTSQETLLALSKGVKPQSLFKFTFLLLNIRIKTHFINKKTTKELPCFEPKVEFM